MVVGTRVAGPVAEEWRLVDPDRLAHDEVAGWRAYYDRSWLRMLWLVVKMNREMYGFSWLRSLQGSYYNVRASIAWVPLDHDLRVVLGYLRKFYRLADRYGKGFSFDYKQVAKLELIYWDRNRRFAGTPYTEESPLIPALAQLHAAIVNVSVKDAWESAVGRAHSLHTVGLITGRKSTDIPGDWARAEEYLKMAYRSLKEHAVATLSQ